MTIRATAPPLVPSPAGLEDILSTPQKGRMTRLERAIEEAEADGIRVYAHFDGIGLPVFSAQRREIWRNPTDHDGAWVTVAHGRDLEDAWSAVRAEGFEDVARDRLAQLLADGSVVYEVPDADAFSALTDRFTRLNRVCGTLGMGSQKVIDWSKRGGAHWRPVVTLQATRAARAVDEALEVLGAVTAGASQVEMLTAIGTAIGRLRGQFGV